MKILEATVRHRWNAVPADRWDGVKRYLLNFLAAKGPGLERYCRAAVVQVVCRITKVAWFDNERMRDLPGEAEKFLRASPAHAAIGLALLSELVGEMGRPTKGRTLTQQRKVATSFRDRSLLHIFRIPLATLKQLRRGEARGSPTMRSAALRLCVACLHFDFIGTNPDHSAEEVGTLQARRQIEIRHSKFENV